MRIHYKPPYGEEVSFDPGVELVCPLCGEVKPVPKGYKVQNSFVSCDADKPNHPAICFDVNALIGMDDKEAWRYHVQAGIIPEADMVEWLEKRTLWWTMFHVGGAPKWKIEPEPFWRERIVREIAERDKVAA